VVRFNARIEIVDRNLARKIVPHHGIAAG
jgi:hypothetical protein